MSADSSEVGCRLTRKQLANSWSLHLYRSPRRRRRHDVIRRVVDSACEEVADHCRDLLRMGLKREVARIEEMDYGAGNIAPERLSTARQEKGIVLSPRR